ncbi:putative integration host factor [Enterococcus phage EF24C]|uniref:Putative integration host factor n=1 Tax=Enterococcus phage phiEF24C TaxID=442493 RepID=A8E2B2_BPPHE|nr:DNA binding protein [Enterococcus phage EF24C]BAF81328.1 putative integration host factor [Enterococcus phage EF24C]
MSKDKTINRTDIARTISHHTGYRMKDILKILEIEDEVVAQAVSQGISVKNHKLWKLNIKKKPEKVAWDGINSKSFIQPEKYVVKFVPLSKLKESIDTYNKESK